MCDRVERVGRRDGRLIDHPHALHPVDPERAEIVSQVVVRREVPAAGVHDEPVRTEVAPGLIARERSVRRAQPAAAPNRLGEEQNPVSGDRHAASRSGGEVERRFERLHTTPQRVRKDAVQLRQRPFDRLVRRRQPEPARGEDTERDDDGFVVRQHQRREAVARPYPIAAAHTALALHGDAQILQRGDVAPCRAAVDRELVGDLLPRGERLGLEELQQLEKPCGRGEHARQ